MPAGHTRVRMHGTSPAFTQSRHMAIRDESAYKRLYPEDLVKLIQNDPNWKNKPIMLGGCNNGEHWEDGRDGNAHWPSFAQMLGQPIRGSGHCGSAVHSLE